MTTENDHTIFALSSGGLPAGVAILRVSGPGVRFAVETIFGSVPEPRRATLGAMTDGDGAVIDRGLAIFFPGPASFTGEDVAEFHVHGGRAVVAAMLRRLGGLPGLRAAEPGEFTRRSFLNGRQDLTEVEGLADLIQAETEGQRRQAVRQASGALRMAFDGWRSRLIEARAMVEADLDFSDEEDVPDSVADRAWGTVREVVAAIDRHLDDGGSGERLRSGAEIVVSGPVNAGKSSLINALARRDVAIVSSEAGTTRDLIEVRLDIGGYPLTLVDTAGLRETQSAVEREGIRRAEARREAADLVISVADVTDGKRDGDEPRDGIIRVGNKIDRIDSAVERSTLSARFDVLVSAETGEGLGELVDRLAEFAKRGMATGETALVTRARHRSALTGCAAALRMALSDALPIELRAEELRRATDALGRLTGRVDVEDLLDVIFRDFCIGK